jgi:hypothetical protein
MEPSYLSSILISAQHHRIFVEGKGSDWIE